MLWQDEGYLLSKNNYNENSIIIEVFTLNHGKYTGMVYGGSSRKQKGKFQIGNKFLINWKSKTAELSFLVDTNRYSDKNLYKSDYNSFLTLISKIVFEDLKFKKLFTETYDIRPYHIEILEKFGFKEEKRIKNSVEINGKNVCSVFHVYENSCKSK